MLARLSIKNYALIDDLEVSFSNRFITITGETGAGKSILLGGLSLVLGNRADLSSLMDGNKKCIIEAEFHIKKYELGSFFSKHDLDYEDHTILRREILPSGKSRAFINDSPVTLDILSGLGEQLVDVHSQHQTLRLADNDFQLKVIDALAENGLNLALYREHLKMYRTAKLELEDLIDFQANVDKAHDYNSFLLSELEAFPLQDGIQEDLEAEQSQLSNVEGILEALSQANQLVNTEQVGALQQLAELKRIFQNLAEFGPKYKELNERIGSVSIELNDIGGEVELLSEGIEINPERLNEVNEQLQLLYSLQKKHQAATISELLIIKKELAQKVEAAENIDAKIEEKQKEVGRLAEQLEEKAKIIRERRNSVIPKLKSLLQENLFALGMPSASFRIEMNTSESFKNNGKDDLTFLFSANKGSAFGELKKVASGGELSRIMLTIKSILAEFEHLPTMMFDEIDTGVSGEISNKMADIMQKMSQNMQVFAITHLPQVASKGDTQFKVYKEEMAAMTHTKMKKLTDDERIVELAEMLGGKTVSESALAHAKQLLQ